MAREESGSAIGRFGSTMRLSVSEHWPMYLMATLPLGGAIVAVGLSVAALLYDSDDPITRQVNRELMPLAAYGVLTSAYWLAVVWVIG